MRLIHTFSLALLSIAIAIPSAAWQTQTQQPQPTAQHGGPAPSLPAQPPYQGYSGGNQPAPGYSQAGPYGEAAPHNSPQVGQGAYPNYPYPRHHNPYYDELNPRIAISNALEWLIALPSNFMDRVSNFIDGQLFPEAPATSGGAGDASAPAFQPPPGYDSSAPLPPAKPYPSGPPQFSPFQGPRR
ncbi:MAG: hypothetical protein FJ118_11315 [Deltaproteobacteria bacterium]|nr:hypothetical protein [Deltaproteobacteria bacterium]